MKNMKKLLALVLALVICAVFALPALAADEETKYTLTMNDPQEGHTYKIYQIFTGTVSNDKQTLSDIQWGSAYGGVAPTETVTDEEDNEIEKVLVASEEAKKLTTAEEMEKFLPSVPTDKPYTEAKPSAAQVPLEGATTLTWTNLPSGYYMVVDTKPDDPTVPISRIMAVIVGNATITTKPDEPTLTKTVAKMSEDNETPEWKKAIGAAFEEVYQFRLLAKVNKENLERFIDRVPMLDEDGNPVFGSKYEITFKDDMSQMTFGSISSVKILEEEAEEDVESAFPKEIEDTDLSNYYIYDESDPDLIVGEGFKLTVDVLDVLGTNPESWPQGYEFYVEVIYTATLKETALVYPDGGNINKATLDYHRDPETSTGEPGGHTPEDKAYVYTFKIDGSKVNGGKTTETLSGAIFELHKAVVTKDENDNDVVTAGDQIGDAVKTETDGVINFKGLDAGKYVLVETKAPDGYNLMTSPIIVTIDATYSSDGSEIETYTHTATQDGEGVEKTSTDENGHPTYQIVNNKGSLLPSTGGIGTTIFYTVGAILVVGAGVILFTKKRIGGKSKG